ncbi:LOW QUALITY PROTEIN: hypothetical protein Smp_008910 [Schistosoma mansoni]|uniref:hypothetical protein n=1 Tax=Schistosoma mansoni TaxID=6183 RepID=UPI00022DBF2B|nr:LOW QUALITY PROTEIN: hypothetical protein Smp_008910 [Schistosoma mansoni]|eukprot:XP_018652746.1 LOW QUALITY PROTEIN: hypothetical protein Smp_008910 [Schistosoma mansoni]
MSKNHESRSSVVDRTAAERISCRLVQQRSLNFGLYRKLNNFNIDSKSSSTQSGSGISENDDNSNVIIKNTINTMMIMTIMMVVIFNLKNHSAMMEHKEREEEDNNTIQNDEFYTNRKIKELGKEFTLKDILGHRVLELEIDNIKDDEDMGHNE